MVMANYNEFNNNNYLPGLYTEMVPSAFTNMPASEFPFRVNSTPPASFTFTSPTQCSTMATPRPSIQTTSRISNLSAPGVGTSWQHSIPVTMPWVAPTSSLLQHGPGSASLFTGIPSYTDCQPSCSSPVKRPKRKALDPPDDSPISKVYLCTDQLANLQISMCNISAGDSTVDSNCSSGDSHLSQVFFEQQSLSRQQQQKDKAGWQRFQEVERRLDAEMGDAMTSNGDDITKTGQDPVLKVADGILDLNSKSKTASPILPCKVIQDLKRPCMQIVLWRSPGDVILESVKDNPTKTLPTSTPVSTTSTISTMACDLSSSSSEDISTFSSNANTGGYVRTMGSSRQVSADCENMENSHPQSTQLTSNSHNFISGAGENYCRPLSSNRATPPSTSWSSALNNIYNDNNNSIYMRNGGGIWSEFDSMDDDMQL